MGRRSPFPRKDVDKLVTLLQEKQDCKVKLLRSGSGYWVGFPNGESTTIHMTSSDTRAVKNSKAIVERNGCYWPL